MGSVKLSVFRNTWWLVSTKCGEIRNPVATATFLSVSIHVVYPANCLAFNLTKFKIIDGKKIVIADVTLEGIFEWFDRDFGNHFTSSFKMNHVI